MVQEPASLVPFFRDLVQKNKVNTADWGDGYRKIVARVQREKPDFSDQTIQDLWYTRNNYISSLRQGGMSHDEFINAKADLIEITKLIATDCTAEVFNEALQRLQQLKDRGVLKKLYRALFCRVFAAFYPSRITTLISESVFFWTYSYCNNYFKLGLSAYGEWSPLKWFTLNMELKDALHRYLGNDPDDIELNMSLWCLYDEKMADQSINVTTSETSTLLNEEGQESESSDILPSKNLILYGPPGTGKTYKSIEVAVRACEQEAYTQLAGKEKTVQRGELKKIYDQLVVDKRIRFITFHQSFGYEEFVEGLRAETSDDGKVRYEIKPGIFKQICEDAAFGDAGAQLAFDDALEAFKAQCAEQDTIIMKTTNGSEFRVVYDNNSTFRIFPSQSKNEQLGRGYLASIENIRRLYRGEKESIYNISYVRGILNYLTTHWKLPASPEISTFRKKKNYALIIDEINRGNISKIFGELITLIETSKRAGESEALSVTLPYSAKSFSVPNNLFIIGTMNTADRSLTALDTALRRRFEFEPLMPDVTVLNNCAYYRSTFVSPGLLPGKGDAVFINCLTFFSNSHIVLQ